MTDIDVPDWVVDQFATILFDTQGLDWPEDFPECADDVRAQIRAALSAWVVPAPALHISERCAACGDVLHASVSSDNHYKLRQEKPE